MLGTASFRRIVESRVFFVVWRIWAVIKLRKPSTTSAKAVDRVARGE
jgi:hypothetical protein